MVQHRYLKSESEHAVGADNTYRYFHCYRNSVLMKDEKSNWFVALAKHCAFDLSKTPLNVKKDAVCYYPAYCFAVKKGVREKQNIDRGFVNFWVYVLTQ
ncbi:hypothetical protein [Pantoea stewartii]|uniref:hypothetical protein n=1 Tax=Pantoea stewartii TaxID=66269 RepID=UPI0019801B5D|nr:hypothetical protein [Pantoea stewartii]